MRALAFLGLTISSLAALILIPFDARAAPGDLYGGDLTGGGTIFKFTPAQTKSTFASGLQAPAGLAFDSSGNLFEGDTLGHTIFKFTSAGTKSTFASGVERPLGLAFDDFGNLFVADTNFGVILKFTPTGVKSTFANGLSTPVGLAFDNSGNLFVVDTTNGTPNSGAIFRFTPTGTKSTFASGLVFPQRLAFDASGNLFVTDDGGGALNSGTILKFTPAGTKSTFASGLSSPLGLAFDASGNLFVANSSTEAILKFTPTGIKTTFATGLNSPADLAFEPTTQVRNISTRGFVGTGDSILIGGFIIGGNALATNSVLVRALGPTLTGLGVAGALQDPTLQLLNASGVIVASNDNWKTTQQSQIQATGLAPPNDHESAILVGLPAGNYTALVRGLNNSTGIALVEVYTLH